MTARDRSPSLAWIAFKVLAQMIVFWSLFLAVLPLAIRHIEASLGIAPFHNSSSTWTIAAWVVFALGGSLGLTSAGIMAFHGRGTPLPLDPAPKLVIRGPYAHVRNPMAIGGLAQGLAVALLLGSFGVAAYVVTGTLLWQFIVRRWEEADLERRFGEPYRQYRAAVPCWIPNLAPFRAA
ncbi:MAG: isoprenylcysteine carboxylmethyltransferase family protein [Phycisphaeraceae bacterium]|nr:isoprenylcysteine carboxylmethyltransferase family protein [Phycisphaeraceae bacterium]